MQKFVQKREEKIINLPGGYSDVLSRLITTDTPTEKYKKYRKMRNKMARKARRINRIRSK